MLFWRSAAAQKKSMNRFLLCSERSETQLRTTIHCQLSWCRLPLTRPDYDEPSVKSIQEKRDYNKSYYFRQTENKWTSCEVTDKLSNEPWTCITCVKEKPFPRWQPRVEAKQILVLPLEKSQMDDGKKTGREKTPCYSNTRSQNTSALCLLYSYKEGGYKNNPRKLYSLGTGLSGSSDSRTSWCRQ